MQAEGLMNLTYNGSRKGGANPYCRVFCYPRSPIGDTTLCPEAWQSSVVAGTVSPSWGTEHTFNFCWFEEGSEDQMPPEEEPPALVKESSTERSEGKFAGPPTNKVPVSKLVRSLVEDLSSLRAEVRALNHRVD